jgi:hypothetical protein
VEGLSSVDAFKLGAAHAASFCLRVMGAWGCSPPAVHSRKALRAAAACRMRAGGRQGRMHGAGVWHRQGPQEGAQGHEGGWLGR